MSKYLRKFETEAEYSAATIYRPSVSLISDEMTVIFDPKPSFKYKLTLSDGSTVSAECTSTAETITSGEVSSQYSGTLVSAEIGDCVTSIGDSAFGECYSLSSIDIPDSVTTIGDKAFYNCRSLSSIDIPGGVKTFGSYAFGFCTGLTNCTIGSGVISIGDYAFQRCGSLSSIDIPDSVTSIGRNAFEKCYSLSSITIPSSVTTIGALAVSYCAGITSITVESTTPPVLGGNAFLNTNNCPIYVPASSVDTYKSAHNWSNYSSRIQAIP